MATKLARALLKPINTTGIIILGIYTTVWGLWIANPFWSVFNRAPMFNEMASLAPEWAWGLMAIIAGLVIVYSAIRQSYRTLTIGSLVAAWHWAAIATFYFVADWMNTGGITCLMIAVYATFVYLNIRVNKVLPTVQRTENRNELSE